MFTCVTVLCMHVCLHRLPHVHISAYTEPDYSLCENSLEWNSIIKGLGTFSLEADVDMHFSIYNPNRISVSVHKGSSIDIMYNGKEVCIHACACLAVCMNVRVYICKHVRMYLYACMHDSICILITLYSA